MSLAPNELDSLRLDLRQILGFTTIRGVQVPNIILAQQRAHDWQTTVMPGVADGPVLICADCARDRGEGHYCRHCASERTLPLMSGSQVERAEREEDRRVGHQAARDEQALPDLILEFENELLIAGNFQAPTRELSRTAARLAAIVARCVRTVDHTQLPKDTPQCRSCARTGKIRGVTYDGYKGVEVYAKAKKHLLCRWCYDHAVADAKARGRSGIGALPPLDVIDVLHSQGPRAAGIALARRAAKTRSPAVA